MKPRLTLFNCATLTASVSALPAATPVIWRVLLELPTETAPKVLVSAFPLKAVYVSLRPVLALYPATPAAVSAVER